MPAIASRPSYSEAAVQPAENARTVPVPGAFVKGQATRGAHRPKRRSNKLLGGGTSNHHKGVYFKQRNNKFVARLCLPGGKNRKLDLGEYNSHDAAACAYRVGAFYYNKPLDNSISEQGQLFVSDSLPCVPENLSDADKLAWVREQARQQAISGNTSEKPRMHRDLPTLHQLSSTDFAPAGPVASTLPASAGEQYSSVSYEELQSGATLTPPPHPESYEHFQAWNVDDAEKQGAETRSHTGVSDMPTVSELRMTDSIFSAMCELRKQGWKWTVKLRSLTSVEGGALFLLPKTQQAAPPLVVTDAIIGAFYELRQQGWEVHLEPTECDNIELRPA